MSVERYTVCSRGVPIGETDLGFARIPGASRAGWFHPNEDGERAMAIVGAVLPLLRASARHDLRDERAAIVLGVDVEGPALPPELAEAMERVEALALTLHRADGTIVPTESIGLQDVELLRSVFVDDESFAVEEGPWDEGLDEETRAAIEHDVAALLEGAEFEQQEPWMPEEPRGDETGMERYQVFVRLVSEWDVP